MTIAWGDEAGGFSSTSNLDAGGSPRRFEIADLNHDGLADLVGTFQFVFAPDTAQVHDVGLEVPLGLDPVPAGQPIEVLVQALRDGLPAPEQRGELYLDGPAGARAGGCVVSGDGRRVEAVEATAAPRVRGTLPLWPPMVITILMRRISISWTVSAMPA